MKYLIVGLGNPGPEYELTRHNIGFLVCDYIVTSNSAIFKPGRFGHTAEIRFKNKQVVLLKPETYMNLSGKAVRYWLNELKIPVENLLIITDDLALPLGKLRLKMKGSDGGHNGLKSINEVLNTQQYSRLRFGIGDEFSKGKQVDYVLGKWGDDEWKVVKEKIELAAEFTKAFVLEGAERAMTKYNNN